MKYINIRNKHIFFLILLLHLSVFSACKGGGKWSGGSQNTTIVDSIATEVYYANTTPFIDGDPVDDCWNFLKWEYLTELWSGTQPSTRPDFTGRYKMRWTEDHLYLLVEVLDDTFSDTHADPLKDYWQDDCLAIFIDEDRSGGNYLDSRNAFAYVVSLSGDIVSTNPSTKQPMLHTDLQLKTKKTTHSVIWEFSIPLFNDAYREGKENARLTLAQGKRIGFAIGYNDVDTPGKFSFMGSMPIKGGDVTKMGENADFFGGYMLVK